MTTENEEVECGSFRRRTRLLRTLKIAGVTGLVGSVGFAGLLLYLERTSNAEQPLKDAAAAGLIVSFFGFFVAWGIVEMAHGWQRDRMEKRLAAAGVAIEGVLLRVRQTGGSVNDDPEIEMRIRIELPERPAYEALHTQVIGLLFLSRLVPGRSVPVIVDPGDPRSMVVDVKRWETEPG